MRRRSRRHSRRLLTAQGARAVRGQARRKRRGPAGQTACRQMERAVRRSALAFAGWATRWGLAGSALAEKIGISSATLSRWRRSWAQDRMPVRPVGRPADRADPLMRESIIALFQLMGPGVGLTTLRWTFPETARGELEDLQRRYRRLWKKKSRALVHALRWEEPGSVWAMDFLEPPSPVDGIYRYVLVVRDLASRNQLAAVPSMTKETSEAVTVLEVLFAIHGAPLVIKSDNGFDSDEMVDFLGERSVLHLLNPPALPRYNGACEAGIGALKTETHWESVRQDRPGKWTCDDVEAARAKANSTHLPWGLDGPTPQQLLRDAQPPTAIQRQQLHDKVRELLPLAYQELEISILPGFEPDRQTQNAVNRFAISRALVALGFLNVRRRRITLPLPKRKKNFVS